MTDITLNTALISSLATFIATWLVQNNKLRNGITTIILNSFSTKNNSKSKSNSIQPYFNRHKLMLLLDSYTNKIQLYLFENETKRYIYNETMKLLFHGLKDMIENINKECKITKNNKDSIVNNVDIDSLILRNIEDFITKLNSNIDETFVLPYKVNITYQNWKTATLESFRDSIDSILHDENTESNIMTLYRFYDSTYNYSNYVLGTCYTIFLSLNGALDNITIDDIKVKKTTKTNK